MIKLILLMLLSVSVAGCVGVGAGLNIGPGGITPYLQPEVNIPLVIGNPGRGWGHW